MTDANATTSQRLDAMQVAQHRRRPLPDTPQADAYRSMMHEVSQFQDALVRAHPSEAQLEQLTATLASVRAMLEDEAVPEQDRFYSRGDLTGLDTQALTPPINVDYLDDDHLRGHFVAGEYYMGMNHAMHGGVVAVVFDTVLGRLGHASK